jgi:ubiquinone/menaquinone biosynthesis C-methylase UbiE
MENVLIYETIMTKAIYRLFCGNLQLSLQLGGKIQDKIDTMSYLAESYERFMVPSLFAPWASYLIERANPQPGERVLDIACGTGIVARNVAPHVGSQGIVIGLDVNPDMISIARTAAEQDHLAIEWYTSPAEQLPFPNENFDLILCQFGLMFFTDRLAALEEMHRVLKTGGRVILSVWQGLDHHPFYQTLHEVSQRHLGKSSVQAVFSLGDSDELRKLLIDSGFLHIEIEPMSITARFPNAEEFLAWEIDVDPTETPALQNLDTEAQQVILAAVRQDMQGLLEEIMQNNQVVLQFHAHVAQARK